MSERAEQRRPSPLRKGDCGGFTLIELAVVIAIFALLIGVGINAISAQVTNRAISESRGKQKIIEQALRSFVSTTGRLPCPAAPALGAGSANYGVEGAYVPPVGAGPPTCQGAVQIPNPFGAGLAGGALGIVPWVTLGLPDSATQDGWGRRFSYMVSVSTVNPNPLATYVGATPSTITSGMRGLFTVHSASPAVPGTPAPALPGNQINGCLTAPPVAVQANGCNRFAVVVLISHGTNGLGAWLPSSGGPTTARLAQPIANSIELENTDPDERLISLPIFQANNPNPLTVYDDLVMWWTPDEMLRPLVDANEADAPQAAMAKRMDRIEQALLGFAATDLLDPDLGVGPPPRQFRRRLPFADALVAAPAPQDGIEDPGAPNPQVGGVPYATLGLNPEDAVDIWGQPIFYWARGNVPSQAPAGGNDPTAGLYTAATPNAPLTPQPPGAGVGFIPVFPVLPAVQTAYVLFSIGPDGTTNTTLPNDTADDVVRFGSLNQLVSSLALGGIAVDP